jgi:hypothetical protein
MDFNFYKIDGSWILEIKDKTADNNVLLKSVFDYSVSEDDIIKTAITLSNSDSITTNVNFTNNKE